MPIKHSISVLMCNFKLVCKLFFFILIILMIASALLIGILTPVMREFFPVIQEEFPISADQFIKHPILSMQEIANRFINFLESNTAMLIGRIIYIWLLAWGSRFLLMFPLMPVTKILHSKMTSGFDMGLVNATVVTIAQNLLFSIITSFVLSVIDMLLFIGCCYLLAGLLSIMKILALPIVLLIFLTLYSFRMSIICQWLPEICASESKNIFVALKKSFAPAFKNMQKNFICVFVALIGFVTMVLTTIIPTVGLFPMLLVPTFMTAYAAMCLALNFSHHKQKYFIDNGVTVYNPVKKY